MAVEHYFTLDFYFHKVIRDIKVDAVLEFNMLCVYKTGAWSTWIGLFQIEVLETPWKHIYEKYLNV